MLVIFSVIFLVGLGLMGGIMIGMGGIFDNYNNKEIKDKKWIELEEEIDEMGEKIRLYDSIIDNLDEKKHELEETKNNIFNN